MNNTTELLSNASVVSSKVVETSNNTVSEAWLVIGVIACFLLMLTLFWVFFTPIGKESLGRWLNKKKYYKGGYTNAIIFTKDGLCKEVFARNIDGKFTYKEDPYVRHPTMAFPYKGIPTLFYIQGTSTPIDILNKDPTNTLSCNELDIVMNHQMNFDFKEWFAKNKMFILIGFGILLAGIAATIYFNYTSYEWIRDSAPALKDGVQEIVKSRVV